MQKSAKEFKNEKPMWVRNLADKVLETFPKRKVYTFAAGISPSGTVHFGNFRDVMTCVPVEEELRERGIETKFIFSWDDFDRFRKVPEGIPESYNQYIGMPLSAVPDPTGKTESYAKYFEEEFEIAMQELGIKMQYYYQTNEYKSGKYDDLIIKAIQERKKIAKILLSFMSEKAKKAKGIDEEKYIEKYYPISLYSRFSGKDSTKILEAKDSLVTYLCEETGKEEIIDITKERVVKLQWKVDWAMRWFKEEVSLEPGGHDHASPGGSYDASSKIIREVYGEEPPVFTGYEFIGLRGLDGKMSGSKGNALSPKDLLKIYQPEILKWLYIRKNPNQTFELAFDTEIFRQYDEYDREYSGEDVIPFRQIASLGEILQWDLEKVYEILQKSGENYDKDIVKIRMEKAKFWLQEYNPEKMIKIRDEVNKEYVKNMDEEEKSLIKNLKDFLEKKEDLDLEELTTLLYDIPKKNLDQGASKRLMQKKQKEFFAHVYNLLISEDRGPRLATFLYALDRKKVLKLLDIK